MNKIIAISLLLLANNIFAATTSVAVPTITKSVSAGTTFKFTETLSGTLPAGHKVKIDLNNGKGLVAMNCSATICTLSSNSLPKNTNPASYKVGIYDSKGVLQGTVIEGIYKISESVQLDQNTNGLAIYTKISNSGAELPDTAKLGRGVNDWACTKDNKTGLIWEVKTDDAGLRDKDFQYSWYEPDSSKNGGFEGYQNANGYPDWCSESDCDTYAYKNAVNKKTLCSAANWRLPTKNELRELVVVVCSDGKYDSDGTCTNANTVNHPAINSKYFPNTQSDWYWTSTSVVGNSSHADVIYFYSGGDFWVGDKISGNYVRLVRR
jgi:hypothetical protein